MKTYKIFSEAVAMGDFVMTIRRSRVRVKIGDIFVHTVNERLQLADGGYTIARKKGAKMGVGYFILPEQFERNFAHDGEVV